MNIPWEALVALLIYIVGSTLGFVWWMATQTIKLQFALEALAEITKALATAEASHATKIELAKEMLRVDREMGEIKEDVDKIRDRK